MIRTVFFQKCGICRCSLMTVSACRENLDRLVDEMYGEVEGKRDGLIIIGRCNKEALKKLNKRYKSVVSVNPQFYEL